MRHFLCTFLSLAYFSLSLFAEEVGEVHIYIFKPDNSTFSGVTISSGNESSITDESGFASMELPVGKQVITLALEDKVLSELPLNVLPSEITEAMLTLGETKQRLEVDLISEEENATAVDAKELDVGDRSGTLQGLVLDSKTGQPIVDARIFVRGVNAESRSDGNGAFSIDLPIGTYAVSIIHSEYTSSTLESLDVSDGTVTEVKAELLPSAVELEGISVVAVKITGGVATLIEEKRESKQLMEIIGAEQMSKSGDSDAASALKRVSGITVVDGKFIYVRGMGERYSNTLIDGLGLPSPIIERRVVPLDLFPADIIDSLVVQKTSSADMPGEFGGGLVQIRTKGIPEERILKLSVSSSYNTESTWENGYSHHGGDTDFLGIDDGTRDLPASLGGLTGTSVTEQSAESIRHIWTPENSKIYPKGSASLTYGDKFGEKNPIGIFATLNYGNTTKNKNIHVVKYSGRTGSLVKRGIEYDKIETTNNIELGGLLSVGTVLKEKHELQFTTLLIRSTDKESATRKGLISTNHSAGEEYSLSWTEQELTNFALHGSHKALDDKLLFKWDASTSEATRDEPDFRYYQLYSDSGNLLFASDSDVFFQPNKLVDDVDDLALAVSYDFDVNGNPLKVETGLAKTSRSREYNARILRYAVGNDTGGYPIEAFIIEDVDPTTNNVLADGSGQNLSSGNLFELNNIANNGYDAEQELLAYYLMFDYSTESVDLNIGARYEKNELSISSVLQGAKKTGLLEDSDLLPSFNIKYKAIERQVFRAGYSRTLNRPGFNEISNVPLQTLKGDPFYTGSPSIAQATIDNYDLRWEFFLSEDGGSDSLSLGVFYKSIDKPIEAYEASSPDTIQYQYGNAKEATLKGIEFDVRSNLAFLKEAWRDYYTSLNYTYVESEVNGIIRSSLVSAGSVNPDDGQPLTGQSENVLNLTLGYDNPDSGINGALLFNFVDERVVSLATKGFPNTILEPTLQLDFVVGAKLKDRYSIKAKVQNILDSKNELTQDGKTVLEYKRGIDFSLGLGVSL